MPFLRERGEIAVFRKITEGRYEPEQLWASSDRGNQLSAGLAQRREFRRLGVLLQDFGKGFRFKLVVRSGKLAIDLNGRVV
jgi:hypothetical protein